MPQIRKKSKNDYINRIIGSAMPCYLELLDYRERVDDCLQGQHTIKSKQKYLPPTQWQKEHPDEYIAYLQRATFYSLVAYAMRIYEGLCLSGSPTVLLPKDGKLDFIRYKATVHERNLHSLQYNLNREQFSHGLRCMLTVPTSDVNYPLYIQEFCANSFLCSGFDNENHGKLRFVLLDQSMVGFNYQTKNYDYSPKLLVLGLDKNDEYYECLIDPFEWRDFDIYNPPEERVKYPHLWERRFNRIPFTWCGASSLSGYNFDIPPLLDMCDLEIKLFQLDAMFSAHLFQSAQETVFFLNAPGNFDLNKVRYGTGAHNSLPKDMDVKVISNNGVGFDAQKKYMDFIMEQIDQRRMSIMSSKSHQSGTAIGIVQNAQTSPLRTVVNTSGDAITEQLRYMAEWMGYDNDDIKKIVYTPSQDFAHADSNLSEFVSLCHAVNEGVVPMLDSDLYRMAINNGYIQSKEEWDDFKKRWQFEKDERKDDLFIAPSNRKNLDTENYNTPTAKEIQTRKNNVID